MTLKKIRVTYKVPYLLLGGGKWETISQQQGWESQARD